MDSPVASGSRPHPAIKRTRVRLACHRCKRRKQKCDGVQPKCSTCIRLGVLCEYPTPPQKAPEGAAYVKALEDRVAELEMALTVGGQAEAAVDHWAPPLIHHHHEPQRANLEKQDELESFALAAVRDVSLNTSGSFIGGTSTVTLARMLGSILGAKGKGLLSLESEAPDSIWGLTAESAASEQTESSPIASTPAHDTMRGMASNTADRLLAAYFKHVAVNFPVVHSPHIQKLHCQRDSLSDPYDVSILNLVYSLGGQFLETIGQLGSYQWLHNYEAALERRDEIIRLGDMRTLNYLLLVIQYCVRVPRDPGAWTFVGIAMRLCVELGLHRKKKTNAKPTLQSELEKRLFWASYYIDRDLAMALGRPPCISDHDIDVELPLDIDEACEDPKIIQRAEPSNVPADPSTTLTCFIHTVRLKRIESRIQYKIYRVDRLVTDMPRQTEAFLDALVAWKAAIPPRSHARDEHSYNHYILHYHKCTRLLLQPQLYAAIINERYLQLCTEACVGICATFKRLHDYFPVAFSTLSLQTVFLDGLTLVYTMWHAPSSTSIKNLSALSDCSIMLYIMTDRWPAIQRYRDAFEAIKKSVLDLIADNKHTPRTAVPALIHDDSIWTSLQGLDMDMFENLNRDDLEQMLGDMAGERMQLPVWGDVVGDEMEIFDAPELANSKDSEATAPELSVSGASRLA